MLQHQVRQQQQQLRQHHIDATKALREDQERHTRKIEELLIKHAKQVNDLEEDIEVALKQQEDEAKMRFETLLKTSTEQLATITKAMKDEQTRIVSERDEYKRARDFIANDYNLLRQAIVDYLVIILAYEYQRGLDKEFAKTLVGNPHAHLLLLQRLGTKDIPVELVQTLQKTKSELIWRRNAIAHIGSGQYVLERLLQTVGLSCCDGIRKIRSTFTNKSKSDINKKKKKKKRKFTLTSQPSTTDDDVDNDDIRERKSAPARYNRGKRIQG